jgi:hypothetical protein
MKCSICKEEKLEKGYGEIYGHNAQPINDGRCCSVCNMEVVVPMRIKLFQTNVDFRNKKETKTKVEKEK